MDDEMLLHLALVTADGEPISTEPFAVPVDAHHFVVWPELGGVPRITCHVDLEEGQTLGDLTLINRAVSVFKVFDADPDAAAPTWQATGLTHVGEFVWHQNGYTVYIEPVV